MSPRFTLLIAAGLVLAARDARSQTPTATPVPPPAPSSPVPATKPPTQLAPSSPSPFSKPASSPSPFAQSGLVKPPTAAAPNIGIGAGEDPPTHLSFGKSVPKDSKIVQVSTHLIVDKASPNGLNFFAIQVNFPNQTWAHGGPQLVKKGNKPVEQVNWGGLVNRGGGSKDYKEADPKSDLMLIESGVGKPNTVPFRWKLNTEYILTVERGKQVHLPAGQVQKVQVGERTMWEWKFTLQPATKDANIPTFTSLIYNSADSIGSFYLWNESGYGSTKDEQHTRWSPPTYRVDGSTEDKVAAEWGRF